MLTNVFWTCTASHLIICTAGCKDDDCYHCLDVSWTMEVTKFRYSFPNRASCHPSKQLLNGQTCILGSSRVKTIPTPKSISVCLIQVQQVVSVCPDGVLRPRDACWHLGAFLLPCSFDFQSHCLFSVYLYSTSHLSPLFLIVLQFFSLRIQQVFSISFSYSAL